MIVSAMAQPSLASKIVTFHIGTQITDTQWDGSPHPPVVTGPFNLSLELKFNANQPYTQGVGTFDYECMIPEVVGSDMLISSQCYHGYGGMFIGLHFDHDLGGKLPESADGFLGGDFSWYATSSGPGFSRIGPVSRLFISAPEPASWALMLVGLGAIGLTLRRRSDRLALG